MNLRWDGFCTPGRRSCSSLPSQNRSPKSAIIRRRGRAQSPRSRIGQTEKLSMPVPSAQLVSHDAAGCGVARSAAEHRTGHQAGAAGISEIEQAADDFSGRVESRNWLARRIDDLRRRRHDGEPAEGKGNAATDLIGLERGFVDRLRSIRLGDRETLGAATILEAMV